MRPTYLVYAVDGEWEVRRDDAERGVAQCSEKGYAVMLGRMLAEHRSPSRLRVFSDTGEVEKDVLYGREH